MIVFFFFFEYDSETDTTVPVPVDEDTIDNEQELEFFYDNKVRKVWHKQEEEWYFSIIDACEVLTDSTAPKRYWSDLKTKLSYEGNETYDNIVRLRLKAADGKMRLTDCANTEQLLRIIQSIPSKKAEPFKLWLAKVGKERLDEFADPELSINRAVENYQRKGYSDKWINQRIRSIEIRNELTNEWKRSGITEDKDYAILTNILTQAWSGKTVKQYKQHKGLRKESLRDNMTNTELALNQLAEVATTELSKNANPNGLKESRSVALEGGSIAGNARRELEEKLGRSVISQRNAMEDKYLLDE